MPRWPEDVSWPGSHNGSAINGVARTPGSWVHDMKNLIWLPILLCLVLSQGRLHSQVSEVYPQEIDDPLVNPYCGWGIWAGPRFFDSRRFSLAYNTTGFGDNVPLFSWVLIDWMWSDLEPSEARYDWKDLDALLNYWKARNKQFLVRLWVTTDPGWAGAAGNKACPDWLWSAGVKFHEYRGEGGVVQRCPAYADPSWETT